MSINCLIHLVIYCLGVCFANRYETCTKSDYDGDYEDYYNRVDSFASR